MAYIIKSSRRGEEMSSTRKVLFSLVFVVIVTFIFFKLDLGGVGLRLLSPALRAYKGATENIASGFGFFLPKSYLLDQNKILKDRVAELEIKLISSESTREFRSDSLDENPKFVRSFVLQSPPRIPYDTLILDKGMNYGIQEGNNVFLGENIVIGRIEGASKSEAKARLFSGAGIKSTVVLEDSGELVEIEGVGGGSFRLELPKEFKVREGEYAFFPGEASNVVARVNSIKNNESSPFLEVLLQIPFKISGNTPIYVETND